MGKISHGGGVGGPIDYVQFEKNRLKSSFFAIQVYVIFFRKLHITYITHLFSIETEKKKSAGLYDHGTYFKVRENI